MQIAGGGAGQTTKFVETIEERPALDESGQPIYDDNGNPIMKKVRVKRPVTGSAPRRALKTAQPKKVGPATGDGVKKKKHRFRPGTQSLREIHREQKKTDLIIPRAPFCRIVRRIANDFTAKDPAFSSIRFQEAALETLQVACEDYIIQRLADANRITVEGKRVTITDRALRLACILRGDIPEPLKAGEKLPSLETLA